MGIGYNPKIVTDGLILCLDAANLKSYPGSGNTWIDLSGLGNNGSLANTPTFSAGSFTFNGTSQDIDCGNATNLQITVGSIGSWFAADATNSGYNGIITKQLAWGLFVQDNILVTYDWGNAVGRTTGINVGNNAWNHVMMTFTETVGTPSNNAIIYLNGNRVLTTTVKHNAQSVTVQIGEGNASPPGQFFGGKISASYVYNRVLSQNEVLQNFNTLRGRYGI